MCDLVNANYQDININNVAYDDIVAKYHFYLIHETRLQIRNITQTKFFWYSHISSHENQVRINRESNEIYTRIERDLHENQTRIKQESNARYTTKRDSIITSRDSLMIWRWFPFQNVMWFGRALRMPTTEGRQSWWSVRATWDVRPPACPTLCASPSTPITIPSRVWSGAGCTSAPPTSRRPTHTRAWPPSDCSRGATTARPVRPRARRLAPPQVCDGCQNYYNLYDNEVHYKDNISRIFWYSDWLHNTTSAGNSIFVTNHNTTSCGRSVMQPIRLP